MLSQYLRRLYSTTSTDQYVNTVVIGAGVIGLSIARALSLRGKEVLVVERHDSVGNETSSRNSEVIHAGLYYVPGSYRARFCIEGKQKLYEYCQERNVPHKQLGKILVATTEPETQMLHQIQKNALKCGVADLTMLDSVGVREMESSIQCVGGMFSPSTGIVDSHALMLALQGDSENEGGQFAFNSSFFGAEVNSDNGRKTIKIRNESEEVNIECDNLVNSGGLGAWDVAKSIQGIDSSSIPPRFLAKGDYVDYQGATPFKHLIYPVPQQGGLGVHLTLDMAGHARFGPDLEWVDNDQDYEVQNRKIDIFYDSVRTYWPDVCKQKMNTAYSGIRPRVNGKGKPKADFVIQAERIHKVPGLVNLFGIESPGLTSCLAIGDYIADFIASK